MRHSSSTHPRFQPVPEKDSLIGIMLSNSCDHFARITEGVIQHLLDNSEVRPFRIDTSLSPEANHSFLRQLQGAIGDSGYATWFQYLTKLGKPVVLVADKHSAQNSACVLPDSRAVGYLAADFWLRRAPASYSFLGWEDSKYSRTREVEFIREMQQQGEVVHVLPRLLLTPRPLPQEFRLYCSRLGEALLRLPKPCGLFAANDYLGALAARLALERNLLIPEELGIIGVDNDRWTSPNAGISLSTIDLNSERIGAEAAGLLLGMIEGRNQAQQIEVPPLGVIEKASTGKVEINDPIVKLARNYMFENLGYRLTIDDLAAHCHVSRSVLGRRFKRTLGKSPMEELNSIRFAKAKELLRETELTIDWVVEKCGFASTHAFFAGFKQTFHMTPSAYRRQHRS